MHLPEAFLHVITSNSIGPSNRDLKITTNNLETPIKKILSQKIPTEKIIILLKKI